MTRSRQIAYRFFAQTVVLLMLYAAVTLLGAVKFLGSDPLADSLPYFQVGAFASVLLKLTIVTGLIGGGVYVAASQRSDHSLRDERLLGYTARLWTLFLLVAFFAGALGLLEGRSLLELPPILDMIEIVLVIPLIVSVARSARTPFALVWVSGMVVSVIGALAGLIPTTDYVQDRMLRTLAVGLNSNVGYVLAAVVLGFWLMHRFSDAPQGLLDSSLYTVAGLLAVAGVLASIPPMYTLGAADWVKVIGSMGVIVIPVIYLIFAAHSYRALSSRNPTMTLAAHWFALGLLLLMLGVGLLGGLAALPGIQQWTAGTRLSDLQTTLTGFGVVAVVLGVVNQAAAELRGQNRRVTGLMPFWLVAFGIVGGALALGGAGLAQVYLERILSVGYLDTQTLLVPLYALWLAGWLSAALGVGIYALVFWGRRPLIPS